MRSLVLPSLQQQRRWPIARSRPRAARRRGSARRSLAEASAAISADAAIDLRSSMKSSSSFIWHGVAGENSSLEQALIIVGSIPKTHWHGEKPFAQTIRLT
eukprot:4407313-Pyramimonas_sp.AAC.1